MPAASRTPTAARAARAADPDPQADASADPDVPIALTSAIARAQGVYNNTIDVFRSFIRRNGNTLDASDVISFEAFNAITEHRFSRAGESAGQCKASHQRTFQRLLTSYLTASDGRKPFASEEEAAILRVVRMKRVWCVCSRIGTSSTRARQKTNGARQAGV